ncbi:MULTISPECIES: hypothetical protein [unclassified Pantoea]|uniref:hypothetical protein n=1 Tax=unclassified Pantoea TaxID=2630326 RepID=UPI001231D1FA|nr:MULTISPECIES: hypothetical protein [unclassified Pantoea]KAA5952052.1 hypothetical protein F3I55_18370 [Pantoea sp. VH_24]KAA5953418.1 hypothetical protein F3I53_22280 [Pantoea sp. VH_16]KAA5961640.1 hypothetical protein F3I54_19210 [Pantoea sp. VH_18]KAA5993348.1 hypothetical protein F3I46_18845 [Pantoea sp. M_1]KAA5998112.1 hypothetical protein F3I45_19490 [Pantoea sp. F_7]
MGFVEGGQLLLALVNIGDGGGLLFRQLLRLLCGDAPGYGFTVVVISSPAQTGYGNNDRKRQAGFNNHQLLPIRVAAYSIR